MLKSLYKFKENTVTQRIFPAIILLKCENRKKLHEDRSGELMRKQFKTQFM